MRMVMEMEKSCPKPSFMNIGSYFQIEGVLLAGAVKSYLQTCNGVLWDLGTLRDVGHLLMQHVSVEGIRTGAEAVDVSWIEPVEPAANVPMLSDM